MSAGNVVKRTWQCQATTLAPGVKGVTDMPFVSHKRFLQLEEKMTKMQEEFDRLYRIAEWHSRRNAMAHGCDPDEEFTRIFTELRRQQLSGQRYCWATLTWHKQI